MKQWNLAMLVVLACGLLIFMPSVPASGDSRQGGPAENKDFIQLTGPANIVQYVRDRFEIPDTTRVDAQPVQHSGLPHFFRTVVTVDDGKQKRALNAFITDDGQCFAFGSLFALEGATEADIVRCVREAAGLPASARISVGAFTSTPFKDFVRSTVTVEVGTKTQKGDLYVTRDRRAGLLGLALPYRRDFVEQLVNTKDQPSVGAPQAPVTIVEYADLECPKCALFQKFLETEFLPKYNSRVRVIFKEFPLPFHEWSTPAAVANECAYQIDPSTFLAYRSLIFADQAAITAANVRDRLLSLGEQAGLNRAKLSACLDSKTSVGRIKASLMEAENLGINGTPTFAINGRVVLDMPTPAAFYRMVDEEFATARKGD